MLLPKYVGRLMIELYILWELTGLLLNGSIKLKHKQNNGNVESGLCLMVNTPREYMKKERSLF